MDATHPKSTFAACAAALAAGLVLAACGTTSTVASRIRANPELFASAAPWQQDLIRQGFVDRGFTPALVELVLEKPTRVTVDAATGVTRWYYHNIYGSGGFTVSGPRQRLPVDPGSQASGATQRGRGITSVDVTVPIDVGHLDNFVLITFRDGVVNAIEFYNN